ncbi:MAG: dihydroxyacetone kinase subunit DhaK [Dysosmobacter welbionis]
MWGRTCWTAALWAACSSHQRRADFEISKEVNNGGGILYLYGNYTGDIMNFDMAAEMCDLEDIKTASIVGADDVNSNADPAARRGVAGIFFMYKCAGAKAAQMGTLDEVLAAAQKAKDTTRTVGFALTPCVLPEVGHSSFTLGENEMAMGMGIHGSPACQNGPIKTADELAAESPGHPAEGYAPRTPAMRSPCSSTAWVPPLLRSCTFCQQRFPAVVGQGHLHLHTFVGRVRYFHGDDGGVHLHHLRWTARTKAMLDMPVSTFYCQSKGVDQKVIQADWTAVMEAVAQIMTEQADHLCEMDLARMGIQVLLTLKKAAPCRRFMLAWRSGHGQALVQGRHEDVQRSSFYHGH